jgi:hypothetical protein
MFFSSVIEKEFLIKRFNTKYYPNVTIKPHRAKKNPVRKWRKDYSFRTGTIICEL